MIADFHAKAIADTPSANLVACTDHKFRTAEKFARTRNINAYPTVAELLADPKLDVVTICTPSGAHMEPAIAAARQGKHVIVEKPLEVNLRRCDRIIKECDKAGVVLSTIFPSRFHRSSQLLKKAIDSGRFGRVTLGDAYVKWFRTQEYYDSGKWRGTWELDGGGALMNQAIHSVDLLVWLMGEIADISAHTATLAHQRIEVEDVATASLRFKSGALGVIEATTAAWPGSFKKIEIHGSTGSATIEEESISHWEFAKMNASDRKIVSEMNDSNQTGGGASDPAAIGHAGHTQQFKDVVKAIKTGTAPSICGREGRKSVEVILAIYQAAISGRRIQLPLKRDPKLSK
jgi:predicted dehydrogenase